MCVILCCTKKYPSMTMLKQAEQFNRDGGSIAWRETDGVHYKKGISAQKINRIMHDVRLPFIIHFRIATVGGKFKQLCHPFPVTYKAETAMEGVADNVLFHNGTWNDWEHYLLVNTLKIRQLPPDGPWSDSRAMAYLLRREGSEILNHVQGMNKIAILGRNELLTIGNGWQNQHKVKCSNTLFTRTIHKKMKLPYGGYWA